MNRPLGSQYVLNSPIGRGATGQVWRGADIDGNPLACKVLHETLAGDPATVQRFLQERSILTSLDHPGLVRVRDLVAEGTTLAIVMDLVEGSDLRSALTSHGVLPPAEACRIGAEVAAGLAAVHAAGVVHRDVKPENVLLDTRVQPAAPRLTDFGVSKIAEQSSAGRSTMLVGTPHYIAPEIFDGQPPSPAVDLYALGIMLYEMCCGVPPFTGDSSLAVLRQHVDYTPGRPDGVPDPLWEVIAGLLAKDPATRLGPAGRVANQLTALAHDLAAAPAAPALTAPPAAAPAVHSQPTELGPPPARPAAPVRRGRRLALVAAAVTAVLVAGLGGWALAQDGEPAPPAETPAPAAAPTGAAEPAPTSPPAPTAASPAGQAPPTGSPLPDQAPVDTLPPPPSDPGVPHSSGTLSAGEGSEHINLDVGNTRPGHRSGGRDLSVTDNGLAAQGGSLVARWSGDESPVPSECHALPYQEWVLFLPPDEIGVDDTFCVLTDQRRYGYFEVREREVTEEGHLRSLTITFMTWSNPDDL